jgi:hypothetical protein
LCVCSKSDGGDCGEEEYFFHDGFFKAVSH